MRFFSHSPFAQTFGIALIRMVVGLLLIYHGQEIFQPKLMESYLSWDAFKGSNGKLLVYAGKATELVAGSLLFSGLFTRLGALLCIGALSYITFFIGQGRFWYEDQHPFMFVLFGILFLFTGGGNISLDRLFFGRKAGH